MTVFCDLHVHSCASRDARHSPERLAQEAKKRGLDAIAICDHDTSTPLPETADVLLIPGTEIATELGHVLGLFLESGCDHAALGEHPTAEQAVREIHRCGGVAVLAHPYAPNKAPLETLKTLPVDGIETANARSALYRTANKNAKKLAEEMQVFCTGGSDAHHEKELGGAVTRIEADHATVEALREALLAGRCRAELVSACKWYYKGLSMMKKAASGSFLKQCKALVYFIVCLFRDLIRYRR